MLSNINQLKFIKKSRIKLKQGNVFYYFINNKYYFGIVLLTQLDKKISDNTAIVVLLVNYHTKEISDFSFEKLNNKIIKLDLISPPVVINKKPWSLGYFVNLENIHYQNPNILELLRFECWDYVCNYQYEPSNDVPEVKLFGSVGIYGYEGIEYLIQVGLGIFFDKNESPYKYYEDDDFKRYIKNTVLPYWYYNSLSENQLSPV